MSHEPFVIEPDQVPRPPAFKTEVDRLRWLICVADPDDKDLSFVASLLSQALKKGSLSDKQNLYFEHIWKRIHGRYVLNFLRCQGVKDE